MKNSEFIGEFLEEAKGHLSKIENYIIQMDGKTDNIDILNELFRELHSIKGTAGFFELKNIIDLTHSMESVFGAARNGEIIISEDQIDILLSANDILKAMIYDVENSDLEYDVRNNLIELSRILNKELNNKKEDVKAIQKKSEDREDINKSNKQQKISDETDTVRVNVNLLNNLVNLVSEMVLARNQLLRTTDGYKRQIPNLENVLQNVNRLTTELQEKVMQTRMQPINNILNKFPRVIRDLSRKLSKEIDLKMEGIDVELDKSIIEALADPLTHLVRNAADHGIEQPDVREKLGKKRAGSIIIKAYHESGYVNVDIIDDGAGIDRNIVKKKALEKGIITEKELIDMTERDVLSLILRPGFSTSDKITDVSGRGVGMDVVNTNVEKIGGIVDIYTKVGEGSIFRLILPLTLAIIPALIVGVENQKFALPQANLKEIIRIKPEEARRKLEYVHNSLVIRLRERLLPIVKLSTILGIKENTKNKMIRILFLKTAKKVFGLVVDAIYDEEEILVKPIPGYLEDSKSYSGVTIMGDGKIAMILDIEGIIEKANLKFYDYDDEINMENKLPVLNKQILRFRCSGPEILGIDISTIMRVEKIKSSSIENIGNREYVTIGGKVLRIIRPERILKISSFCNYKDEVIILIPQNSQGSLAILIEDIIDTICVSDEGEEIGKYLNGRIMLFVDINRIVETVLEQDI